jgi:DUF4097 and DUF4098 domain-containing protein YvlB
MNMNRSIIAGLALLIAGGPAAKAEQDLITKTFSVKPGGTLTINVDRGSIHVTTSDSDKVDLKITRELKHSSASGAKKIFEQHKIEITSADNEVKIEAAHPQRNSIFNTSFNRLRVDYTIAIPTKFDINLKTAGGNIEVADLEGKAAVHTSGGDLRLGNIKGHLKAYTSGGQISLKKTEGDADIHTSGGDLNLGEIDGNLVAHTSGGHITLDKSKGAVDASTSGGNILVKNAYGPVIAHTSGGNVSAQLNTQPKAECSLKTSGGDVDVQLAANLALDLNARTSGGSVHSDFPGVSNKEKTKLTARINGGGPDLVLETSGGNVNIRKN